MFEAMSNKYNSSDDECETNDLMMDECMSSQITLIK